MIAEKPSMDGDPMLGYVTSATPHTNRGYMPFLAFEESP